MRSTERERTRTAALSREGETSRVKTIGKRRERREAGPEPRTMIEAV